jgi:uncharacterized protein (TIGR03085 family)
VAPADTVARTERTELCDLFLQVGPDAPTLCGGWTARDLAAHLVVRERRPDASGGIVLPFLAGYTARVQAGVAEQPWERLVETVRTGPPAWNPMGLPPIEAATNTVEFFVHHEDVRRAQPGWQPRDLDGRTTAALWSSARGLGRWLGRRSPVGITLAPVDGPAAGGAEQVRAVRPGVTLHGPVGEIVLALYGRLTSGLDIDGDAASVRAFLEYPR